MRFHVLRSALLSLFPVMLVGCCDHKFDAWELNGYYVEQGYKLETSSGNRSFSVEQPGEFKDLKWLLLNCDRRDRITGIMGWAAGDSASGATSSAESHDAGARGATFTPVEGRFETIVGTFDTRTGKIHIDDTRQFGSMDGVLEEDRSISFVSGSQAASSVD